MARILVAEDNAKQALLVRRYAEAEGHQVEVVDDGRRALAAVRRRLPDLLILDVMMPGLDGLETCRAVRSDPASRALPILFLTARVGEEDLLFGLDIGADDYLTKPYSPRELMARTRALLRRSGLTSEAAASPVSVAGLTITPATREVRFHDVRVECTPAEFVLLETLVAEPGRVFTREQLLRRLHGVDGHASRRSIDVHVLNLRKKLEADLIRTVHGVGYGLGRTA